MNTPAAQKSHLEAKKAIAEAILATIDLLHEANIPVTRVSVIGNITLMSIEVLEKITSND